MSLGPPARAGILPAAGPGVIGRYHAAARAFKYQLMPNGEQQRQMRRFAGSRRFVFNKALALQKANYEADE
jgi:hypothetical protein